MKRLASFLKYFAVAAWFIFTISLTVWWYIFHQRQIVKILELDHSAAAKLARNQNMLAWEGITLITCLVIGGCTLLYFVYRERRRNEKIRTFFLTFSHELKTPLASLRLQAESLEDDLKDSPHSTLIQRIIADTTRLTIQLENSLFLADIDRYQMLIEEVSLAKVLQSMYHEWAGFEIKFERDCHIQADVRAVESIFRNLLQNAYVHGKASRVVISVSATGRDRVMISVRDNGQGFSGNPKDLAKFRVRHYSGSGNGIGLYLSKKLVKNMGGNINFMPGKDAFEVQLTLQGRCA